MNTKNVLCLVATLALASNAVGQTQSLTELANAEKQRRAKLRGAGTPAKLYTEGDRSGLAGLPTSGGEGAVAPGGAAATAPEGKKTKEKTRDEVAAEKQQEWADRVKKAQDEIKTVEDTIARNERALASMYNITPARADMVAAVETDKKKVADLKKSLVDLEDERRRSGMPRPR